MKNFVLDTNVLIHDPHSLFGFEENTVVISSVVLKELDDLKSRDRAVSADARSVIRHLDALVSDVSPDVLCGTGVKRNEHGGRLYIPKLELDTSYAGSSSQSPDQQIISEALRIGGGLDGKNLTDRVKAPGSSIVDEADKTVFVSRDLNARLLAKAAGVAAQDYLSAQIVKGTDQVQTGFYRINDISECFERYEKEGEKGSRYVLSRQKVKDRYDIFSKVNDVFYDGSHLYSIDSLDEEYAYATAKDANRRPEVFGIQPTEVEQTAAVNALINPDIPLVCITGSAGSGKTLISLAAALKQVVDDKQYRKVIVARAAKDLDEEIGFLPGTEQEKVVPWLGAVTDNLEVIMEGAVDMESAVSQLERYIDYRSLNFMRGRSIQNAIMIIDECQNLTPHQIKTLVTRVGRNTKMVALGDLSQIDNPYLSEFSSGLTYLIHGMAASHTTASFTLNGVPRSELADEASKVL